jgi:pimeloyl-ACP methyl ester carboxylesterase
MRLRSGRIEVALHRLRDAPGPTLLCLHALRGRGADFAELSNAWPGRVLALDFSGHGESDRPRGAAYTPELLAGDADAALAHAGTACLVGVGLGAYVALLLAGARPASVPAAYLLPGAGLEGSRTLPHTRIPSDELCKEVSELLEAARQREGSGFDPMVRLLEGDPRPPDTARAYADAANRLLLAEDGELRPIWWEAVRESASALRAHADPRAGLAVLAHVSGEAGEDPADGKA